MSRRAWRYLIAAVLVVSLGALAFGVSRRSGMPEILQPSFLATQALPELLQRIRDFHRVITREGLKVLEISAREASYFKNDKAIEILEPKVIFYEAGQRAGEVSADKGRLFLDGTDVQRVEVSGRVLFEIGRMRVETEKLTYDRATNEIRATGEARVTAAELSLTGAGLVVNMLERSVVIESGVKMTLHPKVAGAAGLDAVAPVAVQPPPASPPAAAPQAEAASQAAAASKAAAASPAATPAQAGAARPSAAEATP
jgi:LPS export ABC transporter protein LptC